ncbi:MAG: M28 family metallopeptidase [Firmicutes bacterium]|nr:M28 family metallopeptidase [Bacillota bacterium]
MAEKVSPESLAEKVREYSFPRCAGSEGDKKIRDGIVKEWSSLKEQNPGTDCEIKQMEFSYAEDTPRVLKGIFVAFFTFSVVLDTYFLFFVEQKPYCYLPVLFGVLILTGVLSGTRWNRWIDRFYARRSSNEINSANVEAVIKPSGKSAEKTIIFMAHHDSKSQAIGFLTRFYAAGLIFSLTLLVSVYSIVYAGYIGQAMLNWNANIQIWVLRVNILVVIAALLLNVLSAVFYYVRSGNFSPGAVDNASGLAVLNALFEKYVQSPPEGLNLRFVATGAEEEGLIGVVKYINETEKELDKKNTVFVNLDSVGGTGAVLAVDRYGIPQIRTASELTGDLKKAAKSVNIVFRSMYSPAGAGYDSLPVSHRGYEAVTLTNCKFDKTLHDIHSKNDKPENISADGLFRVYQLCTALVGSKCNQ